MPDMKLDIAVWDYDRAQALRDGTVRIPGVDATYHSGADVTVIFRGMVQDRAYDVSELGLTYFLRSWDADDAPFLAIPVFPVRVFRHSAIYVNRAAGIKTPQDLVGKTVGELALYGHDAGVIPKGILSDEYGVRPDQCRWVIGGIDFPLRPVDFVPLPHPADVDVTQAPAGADLGKMLESGEIDALISADVPECVLRGSPKVGHLFEDYESAERDYYRRTGVFPIMHTVVVKKALAAEHPEVVRAVYQGFCDAKDAAAARYVRGMTFNNIPTMIPWLTKRLGEDRDLLGDDWWPYGLAANRAAVDTYLRYHFEQGLSQRRMTCEDIFVPEFLGT